MIYLLKKFVLAVTYISAAAPHTGLNAIPYGMCVVHASATHKVPVVRLVAIVWHESRWRHRAKGSTSDFGLGQIHCPSRYCDDPPTRNQLKMLYDPCTNVHFVGDLLKRKHHRLRQYNPGNPKYVEKIAWVERQLRKGGVLLARM